VVAVNRSGSADEADLKLLHDDLMNEYLKLVDLVSGLDQRLLTIKGWGVTLSLASLGLGFQQDHYGLFLVAALSGLAFWIVEGSTKFHQVRYYPRMGDIEVAMYELYSVRGPDGALVSSPLIDWSWYTASARVGPGRPKGEPRVPQRWPDERSSYARNPMLYIHVMFPHVVAVAAGLTLFIVGLSGGLGPI
jgi:hypothetical protein